MFIFSISILHSWWSDTRFTKYQAKIMYVGSHPDAHVQTNAYSLIQYTVYLYLYTSTNIRNISVITIVYNYIYSINYSL